MRDLRGATRGTPTLCSKDFADVVTLARMATQSFASLANRNYRRYFVGQATAQVGSWMQSVAQAWLVLQLTGSGTAIGLVMALQALPVLLLGPYGGLIADRTDKRRLMAGLQTLMALQALVLGVLTLTHQIKLWHVFVLAAMLGVNNSFDRPARQSFVFEMVGPENLRNAISLNSVTQNAARAVGPAIAGLIIAAGGLGVCFLLNAVSFAAVIISLRRLDVSSLHPATIAPRARGQVREGFRYVRRTPNLAAPLLMMALIGCLAYEFQVVLPVLVEGTFHGDARKFGFMTAAMGAGAVVGGIYTAARGDTGLRALVRSAAIFGVAITAAALAPTFLLASVAMFWVGLTSVSFLSRSNTTLQLESEPLMRGRVMALFTVCFLGTTPIGGPIAGYVSEQFGGRAGLALGAVTCLVSAGIGALFLRRTERRTAG